MWDSLLYKLDSRKGTLTRQRDLMTVFNEMDDCLTDMGIIQVISLFKCMVQLLKKIKLEIIVKCRH